MTTAYILCLDVAFCNTGYALFSLDSEQFVTSGVIRPLKQDIGYVMLEDAVRAQELADGLRLLIKKYQPIKCLAELPSAASKSSRAGRMMGIATGVVITTMRLMQIELFPIYPHEVKRVVSAKGAVSKEQVQEVIQEQFGNILPKLAKDREHVADAMACLLAYRKRKANG